MSCKNSMTVMQDDNSGKVELGMFSKQVNVVWQTGVSLNVQLREKRIFGRA